MNVVIIEEEKKTADSIVFYITRFDPNIRIMAVLKTANESISFFRDNKEMVDLVLSDINLDHENSFLVFKTARIYTPVIFITRFDKFIMDAFEHNGIDYVLKPVKEEDIHRALAKYKKLQHHFLTKTTIKKFIDYFKTKNKTRFIVKWGTENIALPIKDIAAFFTKNKIVYAIDKNGKKYIIDKTMSQLETELDKNMFFRVNRQYIVSVDYIKGFSLYEKVKIELELIIPDFNDVIIISQDTAPIFKSWISKA